MLAPRLAAKRGVWVVKELLAAATVQNMKNGCIDDSISDASRLRLGGRWKSGHRSARVAGEEHGKA